MKILILSVAMSIFSSYVFASGDLLMVRCHIKCNNGFTAIFDAPLGMPIGSKADEICQGKGGISEFSCNGWPNSYYKE
jgi:hypothetical protein